MFAFIEKKQEVKQEKLEYRTHITKYIQALNKALEENSVDLTFKYLLELGTFLQKALPGVSIEDIEKRIIEQSNSEFDPNKPLEMDSLFDPHIPLDMKLPNLQLIYDCEVASKLYIETTMVAGVAGIVTMSLTKAIRLAITAHRIIMNDNDNRYNKVIYSLGSQEQKSDARMSKKFDGNIHAIMNDLITMMHLEQFETEISFLQESFLQLQTQKDEKHANASQRQFINDLVRCSLAISMNKENQLKVNIVIAISDWIVKYPFLSLHTEDLYKQLGTPSLILTYFSRLLFKITNDKQQTSDPELAAAIQAKVMEKETIEAAHDMIKRERGAVRDFINFYVKKENSRQDYLRALITLCQTCKDCHPAFILRDHDYGFFDHEIQLRTVSHRVTQHIGKTYSHFLNDVFNDLLAEIAKERFAIDTNKNMHTMYQGKFLRVLRLLESANQSQNAHALLRSHLDCDKNSPLTEELKIAAFGKLVKACNKRFNQGSLRSPR